MSDSSTRRDIGNTRLFEDGHAYKVGYFSIREKTVNKDVTVAHMNMTAPNRDPFRVAGESDFRGISITLTLGGECAMKNDAFHCEAEGDSTNVIYTRNARSSVEFSKGSYECIALMIREDFLDRRFLDQLPLDSGPDLLLRNGRTNPATRICFGDLLASPYDGELNNMFVQGKVLEILASEFSRILSPETIGPQAGLLPLTRQDVNALNKARDILIGSISDPPSIPTLARMVALNQFKLKKGFKQIFNTTPYAIIRDHRMTVARKLLQSSDFNVGEVSRMVGIKNQAHFTRAFYKRYGTLPRNVMKTRTYFDLMGRPVENDKEPSLSSKRLGKM
jgi:AraC-like DNA-binding protein